MQLELGEHEVQLLRSIVADYYWPSLREQIGDTDNYDLRQRMKKEEETLRVLIDKLNAVPLPN